MNFLVFPKIGLFSVCCLSACGGTVPPIAPNFAPSSSGVMSGLEVNTKFAEITDYIDSTLDEIAEPITDASVTVNGLIYAELATQQDQLNVARLTLNADFVSSTVNGQVGAFAVYQPSEVTGMEIVETLGGSLAITNSVLNGPSLSADLTGTLFGSSGATVVDAKMAGDFISINEQIEIDGDIVGSVTNTNVGTVAIADGTFFAYE